MKELQNAGGKPDEIRNLLILPFPSDVTCTHQAKSVIQRLLCPKSATRLGSSGAAGEDNINSVAAHAWFTDPGDGGKPFDWLALLSGRMTPPIVPDVANPFDTRYFDQS